MTTATTANPANTADTATPANTVSNFEKILKFPCHQNMRFIVTKGDEANIKLIQAINEVLKDKVSLTEIKDSRVSSKGNYISYTVKVKLNSADEITNLYNELPKHDFIKHIL